MKNLMRNKLITSLLLSIFLVGCSDFAEPAYEPEFPWDSVEKLELAVAQPYTAFFQPWSSPIGNYSFYETLATDLSQIIPGSTGNTPYNEYYNRMQRVSPLEGGYMSWVSGSYNCIYTTIAGCNEALTFLESADPKVLFPTETQSKLDFDLPRAISELYFWRGYAYYYGALFFCPPYVPGGSNSDQILPLKTNNKEILSTKIGTTMEILLQVQSDLEKAKSLMPKTWYVDGRINYYAITGALARVYLYMGDYSNAMKECDEIIASGKYTLQSDVMAAWDKLPGEPLAPEIMWHYNPNDKGALQKTFSIISRSDMYGKNGSRGADYSQYAANMIIAGDALLKRLDWMVDPQNGNYDLTNTALSDKRFGNTWFHLLGYKPQSETGITDVVIYKNTYETRYTALTNPHVYFDKFYRASNNQRSRLPLMRVAEFYIMRSALRFKNNDKIGAAADLKVVRDRAGLPEISAASITEETIDREYIIELFGEGVYLPYLIGMQKPILPGDRKDVMPVNPPYKGWFFRLPLDEININGGYNDIPDPNSL